MLHVKFVMINVLRDGLLILKSVKSPNLEIRKKLSKFVYILAKLCRSRFNLAIFFCTIQQLYVEMRGENGIFQISLDTF